MSDSHLSQLMWDQMMQTSIQLARCRQAIDAVHPVAAFYAGFNSEPMMSHEEALESAAAMEFDELVDLGFLDCEPLQGDSWPRLTNRQLADEYDGLKG